MRQPYFTTRRLRFEVLELRRMFAVTPSLVGVDLVYNNSVFDGNNPAAGPSDDAAIASDKTWLSARSSTVVRQLLELRQGD